MAEDRLYEAMMAKALRLARRGEGLTSPNPMVGAVIFNRDGVIAGGYHAKAGGPHAEIAALRKAGDRARGASLAINLEPCCHFGRTGPCTTAIVDAGIKEVIFAIRDPFQCVCGKGERYLRRLGVKVVSGVMAGEATRLNEVYLTYITSGKPFVVLKTAQSLDGRIATRTGESRWISGPQTRVFAHTLRARYDAVVIGSGTVRIDNPQLTVRLVKGRNPRRIVITSSTHLPLGHHLFADNDDGRTIVATTRAVIKTGVYASVETWAVRQGRDGLDLKSLIDEAGKREITSLLIEGGGRLAASLLRQRLVDKYYLILAPILIGSGKEAVGDLGIRQIDRAMRFERCGFEKMGTDILFWGYPGK